MAATYRSGRAIAALLQLAGGGYRWVGRGQRVKLARVSAVGQLVGLADDGIALRLQPGGAIVYAEVDASLIKLSAARRRVRRARSDKLRTCPLAQLSLLASAVFGTSRPGRALLGCWGARFDQGIVRRGAVVGYGQWRVTRVAPRAVHLVDSAKRRRVLKLR